MLIAFESSGEVRRAFRDAGCNAYSCDLLPADDGETTYHIQDDVRHAIGKQCVPGWPMWDLIIAHPPCTYLCSSGLHWNKRDATRDAKTEAALKMVAWLLQLADTGVRIVVENPIGCISTRITKPTQIIQPYQFGEDASKSTCLWIHGLPPLKSTNYIEPRIVNGKKRWANQTDSGQNKLSPSPGRWKERSKTYSGIATAMAEQWAPLLISNVSFTQPTLF